MGRPKLLLPIGGVSVIARVTGALREGGADPVVVVVAPASMPGAAALASEAARAGGTVVVAAEPPPDMRTSVERGFDYLAQSLPPPTFLLAPGDSPGLSADLVARVITQARTHPHAIIIPEALGRRGHPVALPWSLAREIRDLPEDVGINYLIARNSHRVLTFEVAEPAALEDLDTPADYHRWSVTGRRLGALDVAGPERDHGYGEPEVRTLRVTIRLFALARQRAGCAEAALDVAEPATVAALKRALSDQYPALRPLVPQLMIAIDGEYVSDENRPVPPGAEVAAIPPVSGGMDKLRPGVAP
jgi:CTP:molybdopterin cytidylyltransferase MocA/molybdopterin converting factor small subunit